MSKQYAVIGLGKFGFSVATTLAQAGKEVLAVDKDAEPVQEIADLVMRRVQTSRTVVCSHLLASAIWMW